MDEQQKIQFEAHEMIKMHLRLKGTNLAAVGRTIGVSRTTMSMVGLRKLRVPRAEQAIADALGVSVESLFEPIGKEIAK